MKFLKIFLTIMTITSFNPLFSNGSIFPDLTGETDDQVTTRFKKGFAELALGIGVQIGSAYVPEVNFYRNQVDFFNTKTVLGIGNLMVIQGFKETFITVKEKYERYRKTLGPLNQGLLDFGCAAAVYYSVYHMPQLLNDPLVNLGGQGACIALYSYLALRGLKSSTLGFQEAIVQTNFTELLKKSGKTLYSPIGAFTGGFMESFKKKSS